MALTFRGFGLSGADADVCIDLIEGYLVLPSVRGRDWIVPRLDGRTEGNRRKDVLTLPLAGYVRARLGVTVEERREAFNEKLAAVMAVMDPSLSSGELLLSDGYLGIDSGTSLSIQARCKNAASAKITGYNSVPQQLWTFELECLQPEFEVGT